jgi:hypothetical protein
MLFVLCVLFHPVTRLSACPSCAPLPRAPSRVQIGRAASAGRSGRWLLHSVHAALGGVSPASPLLSRDDLVDALSRDTEDSLCCMLSDLSPCDAVLLTAFAVAENNLDSETLSFEDAHREYSEQSAACKDTAVPVRCSGAAGVVARLFGGRLVAAFVRCGPCCGVMLTWFPGERNAWCRLRAVFQGRVAAVIRAASAARAAVPDTPSVAQR